MKLSLFLLECGVLEEALEVDLMTKKAVKDFNSVWRSYSKIKFPDQGLCYDYFWSF